MEGTGKLEVEVDLSHGGWAFDWEGHQAHRGSWEKLEAEMSSRGRCEAIGGHKGQGKTLVTSNLAEGRDGRT